MAVHEVTTDPELAESLQLAPETFEVSPPYESSNADLPKNRFLDRELSWLAYNTRVLEQAEDEALPLLERVRFAAFFAGNLDEFFMVRVAGLKRRIAAGVAVPAVSGLRPREVLDAIWRD
ncbi:MAG: RNA degradosome polyphosphate kinase, partial [Nocardioidaceae bacterium]|nr:RNA degradosome polyphosphate kinase [Nocardioidaceae bacterium]